MVAKLLVETLIEKPIAPTQQTIEIGKITLMLPIEVDPTVYSANFVSGFGIDYASKGEGMSRVWAG